MAEDATPEDAESTESFEEAEPLTEDVEPDEAAEGNGLATGEESTEDSAEHISTDGTRPWYRHPLVAIGLVVAGVAMGAIGISGFTTAGSEGEKEDTALEELAALEAQEAALTSDADALRAEIDSTEADTAATRDEIASTQADISAAEAETAAVESDIAATEAPIRDLQREMWDVYAALQRTAELQDRITNALEAAVISGNQRNIDGMQDRAETVERTLLSDLENAVGAVDQAIADAEAMLIGADTSLEITEDFDGEVQGWEAGFAGNGVAGPVGGGYMITTNEDLLLMWGLSPYAIADVIIEVTAEPTGGPTDGTFAYGVLCRAEQTDYLSGYLFAITGEGEYIVGWYEPPGEWVDLLEAAREDRPADATALSAAINRGFNQNALSVTCNGPDLSFRVNGVTVWEGTDDNLTEGRVALAAYTFGGESVIVVFDDLRLTAAAEEGGGS